ncbi:MAG: chemotaxis protein CheW [Myxococcaceae bacterium]
MSGVLDQRARQLRETFDRAFAEPRDRPAPPTTDFLGLRVAGEPYAIRLSQVAALHVDRKVAALPSPDPLVAGVVSLRGTLHTVFDLRAVLGKPTALPSRWLIALAGAPAAYLFDGFDGLLRVETALVEGELLSGPPKRPVLNLQMKGS